MIQLILLFQRYKNIVTLILIIILNLVPFDTNQHIIDLFANIFARLLIIHVETSYLKNNVFASNSFTLLINTTRKVKLNVVLFFMFNVH